jgi:hypothetical protein
MNCRNLGLLLAIIAATPAAAAVNATHDPGHDASRSSPKLSYERILEVNSRDDGPNLPLECRGYNVQTRTIRSHSLSRCE